MVGILHTVQVGRTYKNYRITPVHRNVLFAVIIWMTFCNIQVFAQFGLWGIPPPTFTPTNIPETTTNPDSLTTSLIVSGSSESASLSGEPTTQLPMVTPTIVPTLSPTITSQPHTTNKPTPLAPTAIPPAINEEPATVPDIPTPTTQALDYVETDSKISDGEITNNSMDHGSNDIASNDNRLPTKIYILMGLLGALALVIISILLLIVRRNNQLLRRHQYGATSILTNPTGMATTMGSPTFYTTNDGGSMNTVAIAMSIIMSKNRDAKEGLNGSNSSKQTQVETPIQPNNSIEDISSNEVYSSADINAIERASSKRSTSSHESVESDHYFESKYRGSIWEDPAIIKVRLPFNQITALKCIGKGGFGEVYHGYYQSTPVAIKRVLSDHSRCLESMKELLEEVKVSANLKHSRIVEFIGVAWDTPNNVCILSEYMSRGDLSKVTREWRFQNVPTGWNPTKLKIALHIAQALQYLHAQSPKIIHRDLKPRNILLNENWDAKISDFGISREQSSLRSMTSCVGSSLWMAPEVLMGENYNEQADMFSFGIVLTELDTLLAPYHSVRTPDGRRVPEAALVHMMTMGKIIAEFSSASRTDIALLGRACLSLDPYRRPTANQVAQKLQNVLSTLQHK